MTRAAANSMASGTPSRRWQISTTARALLSVSAKSALTCRARSTNRLTASVCTRRSMSSSGSPTASGGSAISCSPSIAMPSRLVASTTTPGHSRSMRVTSRATAPSTCSQLSSTNSSCFWASISTKRVLERLSAPVGQIGISPPPPRRRRRDRAPGPTRPAKPRPGSGAARRRRPECQAGLADSAHTGDRHHPRIIEAARPGPLRLRAR